MEGTPAIRGACCHNITPTPKDLPQPLKWKENDIRGVDVVAVPLGQKAPVRRVPWLQYGLAALAGAAMLGLCLTGMGWMWRWR